jgi:hypothetical protein
MASASGIRSYVDFEADFPEEEETNAADAEIPLGRPIAEHLHARLEAEKFVVCEVYQHSFYGWAFEVRFGNVVVWCMLQGSETWLLITEVPGRWLDRLLRRAPDEKHQTVLDVLRKVLAQSPFHDAKWSTPAEHLMAEEAVRTAKG